MIYLGKFFETLHEVAEAAAAASVWNKVLPVVVPVSAARHSGAVDDRVEVRSDEFGSCTGVRATG